MAKIEFINGNPPNAMALLAQLTDLAFEGKISGLVVVAFDNKGEASMACTNVETRDLTYAAAILNKEALDNSVEDEDD